MTFLVVGLLLSSSMARSQSDLENVLKQYDSQMVKGYIQPLADLFGANMNAGLFHSAAIPTRGLHIELDIIGMGSIVTDDQKKYQVTLPPSFSIRTLETSTIFGPKGTEVSDPSGFKYKGSDGILDASLFPLAVPQLTVGYVYGTEATVRFVTTPSIGDDKFPKTTLFGAGVRHSISQYIPQAPLDIALGFFYNTFTVGDIIDFKAISIGAQGGKTFSVLSLYGGLAWEKSTMNLDYTQSGSGASIVSIELDGANTFRGTLGAGLKLGFLSIFADANFGSVTNLSGGIGFGI
jgi:hypothetical protein